MSVKLLYLFDILSQGQGKISAILYAIIRSMQCINKKNWSTILAADEDQSTQHM